jgi:hypothetical protein
MFLFLCVFGGLAGYDEGSVEVLESDEWEVVRVRFVDLCLERSIKIIRCVMYLKKTKYLS